jgi:hypothetical protein
MSPRGGRRAVHEERLTRHGSKRIAPASGQHRLENGAAAQAENDFETIGGGRSSMLTSLPKSNSKAR